jgi:glycosyltransferase involved in cell wall biosynthesis
MVPTRPPLPDRRPAERSDRNRVEAPMDTLHPQSIPSSGTAEVTVGIPTWNRSHLLARAIESVLAQRYPHFTVLVSDNASDDDTAEVVRAFEDPRIDYRPLAQNIGRAPNFNRVVELAQTDFVMVLGDDDELHPDHLQLTVEAIRDRPKVGVVHTGYSIVDGQDNELPSQTRRSTAPNAVVMESGGEFLERTMSAGTQVCFSSALFRRSAFLSGGGLRAEDGVVDDFPLFMRMATNWDFAYVNAPLAVLRAHDEASSSTLGSFTPRGYRTTRAVPEILHEHRVRFLGESGLPDVEVRRLARLAERGYRRDILAHLSMRATTGDSSRAVFAALRTEIRRDQRLLTDPRTWRFVAGQLGGRRIRDTVVRMSTAAQPQP